MAGAVNIDEVIDSFPGKVDSFIEDGLGQDSLHLTGETRSATSSKGDQAAILARTRQLEAQQGKATVVPTFP